MLDPACGSCGCTLRAVAPADIEHVRLEEAREPDRPAIRRDATGLFAALVIFPWLLPMVGVSLGDVVFLIPLILLGFATQRAHAASRRDEAWCCSWRTLAVAAGTATVASLLAVVTAVIDGQVGDAVFYAGATSSVALVAAAVAVAVRAIGGVGWEKLVDAMLLCLVAVAVTVYFVVIPGLRDGDVPLTLVVVLDLAAFALMAVSAVAQGGRWRTSPMWWLAGGLGALVIGDSLVAAAATGHLRALPALTALLWAVCGYSIAAAAERGFAEEGKAEDGAVQPRWVMLRVVLPLLAVLSFPAVALWLLLADRLSQWGGAYFAALFVIALVMAFGRQAILLVEHQRNIVRERRLRKEAIQRSEELEALTGLATTMTQTLEEAPIVEQALGVLAAAARASSAALQLVGDDGSLELRAATGAWHTERTWAGLADAADEDVVVFTRGGRTILRLALSARDHRIGTVTLVRSVSEPFDERGVSLLQLLVGQMGVAVQNARDYREKLEQAIRDPLTGLYNRRFFLETLEKEVQRASRYGSEASIVLFDVDDFKQINDTYGHPTGDDVLRRIATIATEQIRPVDSFARIGGEEFALLMPETPQMEALLVAERLRTTIAREAILEGRRVTVSGGLASCPADSTNSSELQQLADAALYWAKRNGKDLCAVASEITVEQDDTPSDRRLAQLHSLVAMIDEAHLQTRDHSQNVASYAVAIGQELGLAPEAIVRLRRAAMLHDIGKVAVSSIILVKPDVLTDEEYAEIKTHSEAGGRILAHAGLHEESAWVRAHHERYDGRGYPDGLAGSEIPHEARIIFVADSFEAMTSDRPYHAGMTVSEAVSEVQACAGTQFDPAVVDALSRLVAEDRLAVLALRRTATA